MGAEGIGEPRSNGGHEDIMKNYPAKASLEEMTGLYQYTILPLLVETDQFLKNLQGQKRHRYSWPPYGAITESKDCKDGFDYNGLYESGFI